jgi:hypothetical protein
MYKILKIKFQVSVEHTFESTIAWKFRQYVEDHSRQIIC